MVSDDDAARTSDPSELHGRTGSCLIGGGCTRPALPPPIAFGAGWWALVAAVLATPLTAATGWYWMRQMQDMDHAQMPIHKWLGISLAGILPLLLWARWRTQRKAGQVTWAYLAAAGVVVAVLTVQGHLGGTMSFGNEPDTSPPDASMHAPADVQHPDRMGGMQMKHETPPTSTPASSAIQWKDHIDLAK